MQMGKNVNNDVSKVLRVSKTMKYVTKRFEIVYDASLTIVLIADEPALHGKRISRSPFLYYISKRRAYPQSTVCTTNWLYTYSNCGCILMYAWNENIKAFKHWSLFHSQEWSKLHFSLQYKYAVNQMGDGKKGNDLPGLEISTMDQG